MRSSWIDRLFRHVRVSDQTLALSQVNPSIFPARATGKSRGVQASHALRTSKTARICLGIGDGGVHWQ
ncbi:MAG: hypothetical protein WA777_07940 [Rhodanobacter sp.]